MRNNHAKFHLNWFSSFKHDIDTDLRNIVLKKQRLKFKLYTKLNSVGSILNKCNFINFWNFLIKFSENILNIV